MGSAVGTDEGARVGDCVGTTATVGGGVGVRVGDGVGEFVLAGVNKA